MDADYLRRRWLFLKMLAPIAEDTFLDLGGGKGIWAREFAPHVKDAFLVDKEARGYEGSLETARQKMKDFHNFQAIDAEVTSTPFPDAYFDKILCAEVIEHVSKPNRLLLEISRLLKPKGVCLLTTPHSTFLASFPFPITKLFRKLPHCLQNEYVKDGFEVHFGRKAGHIVPGYSEPQLRDMANQAGLTVCTVFLLINKPLALFYDLINCLPRALSIALKPFSHLLCLFENKPGAKQENGLGILVILRKPTAATS